MVQLTLHIWMDYKSDLECHLPTIICFVLFCFVLLGPVPTGMGTMALDPTFESFTLLELVSH
jgi:hypothetical protein